MAGIYQFDTIASYNDFNNHETLHPLVSVIDFGNAKPRSWEGNTSVKINYGFYTIFLKDVKCGDLKYGCNYYDYQEGTLVFVAPGQVLDVETDGKVYQPKGYGLVFHEELIHGTALGNAIKDYHFFEYKAYEALHLSERERQVILDCFAKINFELQQAIDKHSKKLIVSNLELLLNYCVRFYDRQFTTRENVNKGILGKFENILNNYFTSDEVHEIGLPSVAYCADALHLSANYFGDLIKKETGKTAKEYIQTKIINVAKNRMYNPDSNINEIAYELGFKYPQHFTRMFKSETGYTPSEFRALN